MKSNVCATRVKLVVHRDRDYMTDEDANGYIQQVTGFGAMVFLTDFSDMEGYLLDQNHINALYPQVGIERASEIVEEATALTRDASTEAIINLRTERAWRRRAQGAGQPNVGEIALAAQAEYEANPQPMRRGKRVLAQVRLLLQQELGGHPNLEAKSSALAVGQLVAIANAIWPPA